MNDEMVDWAGAMRLVDRLDAEAAADPLEAFALDELLCRRAGETGEAFCHMWRHPNAFVLGQRDSRLPHAAEASRWLESQGWQVVVRHSGGAAVPLDAGVVNLSLIFPKSGGADARFRQDFERMYAFVREALAFAGVAVDKGEIAGAYCPGDYDLSIAGRKFCGIAQRRQLRAACVQAFVVAGGAGADRTRLVRAFYERAAPGAEPSAYPQVADGSTASLEELAGFGANAARAFADAVRRAIGRRQGAAGAAAAFGA
ncbi:lipoate--protein ligase family protein, partial [Paenibacillus pasadenensis]